MFFLRLPTSENLTARSRSLQLPPGRNRSHFLPLHEAEVIIAGEEEKAGEEEIAPGVPLWRTLILSTVSLIETLLWLGIGCYSLVVNPEDTWNGVRDFLVAVTWLYAVLRPIVRPTATAPFDLLWLYSLHLILNSVVFFGHLYDRYVYDVPLPTTLRTVVYIINLVAVAGLLLLVLRMPLAIPSKRVKKEDIGKKVSPEDYTTVWGWASFRWVMPLLNNGTYNTLNEEDVWALSPSMQAKPLHLKFSRTTGLLFSRLWRANALDLVLDFVLTYVSVVFNYASPFFLKRILDALDTDQGPPSPERRALAFLYAFLAFMSAMCKAQADVQHLWYGRRACTRIRTELMSSIYDKALKRKDFSGIVDKDAAAEKAGAGKAGKGKEDSKADDPKAGADVGKIVNLMAGDANRIAMTCSAMYFIYGAPFEIFIATVFLYQLLGWSAFAGFFMLLLTWPLNNFMARRAVRIQKGVSTARDKRMGVLNELISAVKFIKFFAWEDRWIQRVLDAREGEMQWMIKARVNAVCFSLLWTTAPILVSVTSFFVYVAQGNELTIGTAFTAIALYQMVRAPLNVIPAWIVQILQSKVALDRIATYLDEDEVDEQVSTIKKGRVPPSEETETGLGIVDGSFKWNEVEQKKDDKHKKGKGKDPSTNGENSNGSEADEAATAVDDASVVSAPSDHRFELRDINVLFPEGELTLVTGPTASGKTALLMALLGELTTLEGRIVMSKNASKVDEHGLSHTISYAAQSPWLRHQSIKDNILFGYPYDEERYKAVVECCALKPDLDILEDGDATEIGARGVSLSGGQKARVALARAVYSPTKYVLLDDPLSAVDSHTARFLFERLLRGPLLAHRTVILVTHHVELVIPGANYLVRMLDGRIDTQGTIKDLRASGILDDIAPAEELEAHKDEQAVETAEAEENPNAEIDAEATGDGEEDKTKKKPRKLIEEEHRETGSVKWNIYNTYLEASSYWTWGILFTLIILTQISGVGEKVWIKIWGGAYGHNGTVTPPQQFSYSYRDYAEHQHVLDDGLSHFHHTTMVHSPTVPYTALEITFPPAQEHPYFYIGIYTAIALSTGIINILGVITQYTGALRASRILFEKLLRTVVRATMRWHDVTPQGRMLNRFSKDVETVDTSLASTLQQVNQSLALFAVSMLTVIYVFPFFIFPAIVLGFFYRQAAVAYLNTGRDIRRMESNTRSPIFANFSELLEGIVTVRAFGAEERFLSDLYTKVDLTTQMWYTFWMTNRWLLLTFDTLGAAAILGTTLFALSGYVDAGLAGVCITSAMSFTNSVYWACRFWTALELDLNSVERVVEYLDLPQEPAAIIESNRPPAYWPSSTSENRDSMLVVENLSIKYAPDLPAVLKNISFSLKAKERVGLLGRTGSGKSTLAMSILRFVDPASGNIFIDGIDIGKIGLHDLRSRMTFIPQDATLFSGTLRENLDPFGEHTDAECIDVLQRVQMITDSQAVSQRTSAAASRAASIHEGEVGREATIASVSTSPTEADGKTVVTLDTQVSPGGTNFSQGQRQLIAMARALLRRSAIIVLDEATSSIDFATDAKIQATIREEFGGSLLLTVAHRLRTVIDYDRLIVLDKGELAEFDTPLNLIRKEGGIFRSMCLKSGTFAELEAAAKAKAEGDLLQ
ncbi:ATP-binding cassette transporter [Ganoderma sinense ZZ0214-1]|uniref:ATP-binding cassette transporter n=1 Tax=Ganoderma sinense ZZ0214-1 TaxID=1077348 RepID=A0A2G8S5U5_9APHY|nr:ATP-binding cassette transporter [Ganoderma sinense ZZ0214-1]